MGSAVVRCTSCLGVSQVETGALGLIVRCPRCDATFVAIEEAEVVVPARPARNPLLPVPEQPDPRRTRRRRSERRTEHEPRPTAQPTEDHDLTPSGPLPASVLIGLALLPFAIPILWLIAPAVTGVVPAMSIAAPSALALSASILCLAVIYTVDWTPTTRIKGVLMLVGLAYFGAVSLYFLKQEMVERFKRFTGLEERVSWRDFNTADYKVRLPGTAVPLRGEEQPLASLKLNYHTATCERQFLGQYRFVCGSLRLPPNNGDDKAEAGTQAWFEEVAHEIVNRSGGQQLGSLDTVNYDDRPLGREVWIQLADKESYRVVRLFVIRRTVYYLSVQGMKVDANDDLARIFFKSFEALNAKP